MEIESIQSIFSEKCQTRILTHKGKRVIEKAFRNGNYSRKITTYKNHNPKCDCNDDEFYTKEKITTQTTKGNGK